MNELFKRTITGFIYVFLLLSAIMLNADAFDFLFLSFGIICLFEFKRLIRLKELHIFLLFLLVWWLFIHLKTYPFSVYILLLATLLANIYLTMMLFNEKTPIRKQSNNTKLLISLLYIGGGCIFMPLIYKYENNPNPNYFYQNIFNNESQITMIGMLCIIWASDSFAYLTGKAFGKHKLFERISPKKSWEGSIGGAIFSIASSFVFAHFFPFMSTWQWAGLVVTVVIFGTWGDLTESLMKRQLGIKDSGNILPGHGGMLDRFDSALMAIPAAVVYLYVMTMI